MQFGLKLVVVVKPVAGCIHARCIYG
jgi:hypothetical protein